MRGRYKNKDVAVKFIDENQSTFDMFQLQAEMNILA